MAQLPLAARWFAAAAAMVPLLACSDRTSGGDRGAERLRRLPAPPIVVESAVGVTRGATGTLVVADFVNSELVIASGTDSVRRLGRTGRGPGEFSYLHGLHRCDSFLVGYDFSEARLQLFSDTAFVRQLSLPVRLVGARFLGCAGLDRLVFVREPDEVPGAGAQRFPLTVLRFDGRSEQLTWIATLPGSEMWVAQDPPAFFERPFGTLQLVAAGPTGVVSMLADRPVLTVRPFDGENRTIRLDGLTTRRVTADDRRRYRERALAERADSSARAMLARVLDQAEWGARVPIADAMVVAADGRILLRLSATAPDSAATWLVVDPLRATQRRYLLPREERVLYADSAGVATARTREDGSVAIHRYAWD